jgi:methyl-accepting chemotaxis protein
MQNLLARLSLKYQIGLIGAIGVLGLITFAAAYFASSSIQAEHQMSADQAQDMRLTLNDVEIGLLQARRAEKDFLLRHEERYLARHAEAVAETRRAIAALATRTTDPELKAQIDKAAAGVDLYARQFTTVGETEKRLGLDENSGLQGALRKAVHEVEQTLGRHDDRALAILMLMMRRHEKDFLLRGDAKYGDDMKKRGTEFTAVLAASSLPAAERETITSLMTAYQRDFAALLAGSLSVKKEIATLSSAYSALEPVMESIAARVVAHQKAAVANIESVRGTTARSMLIGIGVGLAVIAFLAFTVGQGVCRPLLAMTGVMSKLAGGDFALAVPATERRDEVGRMAKSVLVFKDNMIAARDAAAREAAEQKLREARAKRIGELTNGFDADVSSVLRTVASATTEMQSTAASMTATAEETSRQAAAVAAGAEEASTNVQTVASASEELTASITEISRQVSESARIANQAVEEAGRTNASVQGLADAAQKIGDVIKLINDIAGQTNLLALNATIEAARAGEAGKGFAVVASEVKSLATQTAKATEEITTQVGAIQSATRHAVDAIQGIGKTIGQINGIATTIAAAVEEQGAATQEISRNVQQAAAGTQEVTSNITGVNQAASDTGAAATQVLSATSELSKQSETLRGQVEHFLAAVKAA